MILALSRTTLSWQNSVFVILKHLIIFTLCSLLLASFINMSYDFSLLTMKIPAYVVASEKICVSDENLIILHNVFSEINFLNPMPEVV